VAAGALEETIGQQLGPDQALLLSTAVSRLLAMIGARLTARRLRRHSCIGRCVTA